MSYPDEAKIKLLIEEIATYGYCSIDDTISVYETEVIESMMGDTTPMSFIIGRMINGLHDMAIKLNIELYEKHARSLVVDALASVEKDNG